MLQTHERVVVAIGRGSGVYGSSAAPQQSTEVKPAKSASHLERLSDPPLSSGHGLEPVAEQLQSMRSTAAAITSHAPLVRRRVLSTAAAGGETPTGRWPNMSFGRGVSERTPRIFQNKRVSHKRNTMGRPR